MNQNEFLQLLITQLQNQDPLNPTDTNQFVDEMCQLTGVQALTNMQTDLDNVASSMKASGMGQMASAIGDYMQVSGTTISMGDEVVLSPSGNYDSLTLTLRNASGNETTQTFGSGQSPVYNDTSGNYNIVGATQTTNGVASNCNYNVYRLIAGVQSGSSGASLVASDGTAYPTSQVTEIIGSGSSNSSTAQ
jgi:flagellar basal-body rod modification protein FlgD